MHARLDKMSLEESIYLGAMLASKCDKDKETEHSKQMCRGNEPFTKNKTAVQKCKLQTVKYCT